MTSAEHTFELPLSIDERWLPDVQTQRLEQFARLHFKTLWRLAQRMGLDSAEAEDVVLRTLNAMAQKLNEIADGKERAFLVQTTINITRRVLRSRRRKPVELIEDVSAMVDESASAEDRLDQRRALALLGRMLSRLSLKLREPLILFEIEGYSQSEIAEILDLPLGTVASRLRRGRERFLRIAAEHNLTPGGIT